ncbi:MAG TPA: hypothetical protein VKA91_02270 [Nitrososphaeraceae archaeon]|nr:hypothetical protein [Nitrososphaeraceae archaeon]
MLSEERGLCTAGCGHRLTTNGVVITDAIKFLSIKQGKTINV